jgi:uncharacterized membrane protein
MTDLVERYVHQVGSYLPQDERKEIENELRSLIQDQLEDRYKGSPTEGDVVELLTEFGEPRRMAASYSREQYLIGPDLYPTMMRVLQRGWVLIPAIVVLVNLLVSFLTGQTSTLLGLLLETAFLVIQVGFIFSAVVVLIFAIVQHTGVQLEQTRAEFDPLKLPPVGDPAAIDRTDAAFSIAFGTFWTLVLVYFLIVGGLTLRFNPSDPGDVLAVPRVWLIAAIISSAGLVLVSLLDLRRGRYSIGGLLVEGLLELIGAIAGYFVIFKPLFDWLYSTVPALASLPFAENAPLFITVLVGFLTLVDTFSKIIKILWGGAGGRPFISVDTDN